MLALVLALGASAPRAESAPPPWTVTVVRSTARADTVIPPAPSLQGRIVVEPLIEGERETLRRACLLEVAVRNRSRTARTLRWDVSRSPYLRLEDGSTLAPVGHKLSGLAKHSVAIKGVLEVDVPGRTSYTLYPVYALERIPRGTRLVIDSVGVARVRPGRPGR